MSCFYHRESTPQPARRACEVCESLRLATECCGSINAYSSKLTSLMPSLGDDFDLLVSSALHGTLLVPDLPLVAPAPHRHHIGTSSDALDCSPCSRSSGAQGGRRVASAYLVIVSRLHLRFCLRPLFETLGLSAGDDTTATNGESYPFVSSQYYTPSEVTSSASCLWRLQVFHAASLMVER